MKLTLLSKFSILATVLLSNLTTAHLVRGATFGEQAVEQSQFIAIARPYGENKYDLLVIEQIPGQQQCWRESGSAPVSVEPLLLNFDFTGSCQRNTDSNGYSIRVEGQDYGLDYLFRIVERNGELVLLGTPRSDLTKPEILVGRTRGLGSGFLKIILEPGWKFAKRTYEGKVLGHVYFSGDRGVLTPADNSTIASAEPAGTSPTNSNSDDGAIATAPTSDPSSSTTATTDASNPVKEITFTAEDNEPAASQAPLAPLFPPSSSPSAQSSQPDSDYTPLAPLFPSSSSSSTQSTTQAASDYKPLEPLFPSSSSSSSSQSTTQAASDYKPLEPLFPASSTSSSSPSSTASGNTLPPPPSIPSASQTSESQSVESPDSASSSTSEGDRANLSDLLVLAPASTNSDVVPVPQPPSVSSSSSSLGTNYRVMVSPQNTTQQEQVRSLYPDAFPTAYNGQSMWQIGVFSSRDNAETALQSLKNLGVDGTIAQ